MPAQRPILLTLLLGATLLLAGCTSPEPTATVDTPRTPTAETSGDDVVEPQSVSGSTGAVGGKVKNSAPTVPTFTQSATEGENRGGFTVVFTGTVRDANTERQLKNISVTAVGPSGFSASRPVTTDDVNLLTEPASFTSGWKVWTGTKHDGIMNFQYSYTFPAFTPAGTYTFTARAEDTPGASGVSVSRTVVLTAFSDITINPTPVGADGAAQTGQNWGQWDAEAGATNVAATNYIKIVNTGDVATSSVVIDFAASFVGAEDGNFTIPVANNVQFAWAEGGSAAKPSDLTFNYGTANADGTTTVTFSAKDNVIFVIYRIVQLPEILPVQSYGIAYTVNEL